MVSISFPPTPRYPSFCKKSVEEAQPCWWQHCSLDSSPPSMLRFLRKQYDRVIVIMRTKVRNSHIKKRKALFRMLEPWASLRLKFLWTSFRGPLSSLGLQRVIWWSSAASPGFPGLCSYSDQPRHHQALSSLPISSSSSSLSLSSPSGTSMTLLDPWLMFSIKPYQQLASSLPKQVTIYWSCIFCSSNPFRAFRGQFQEQRTCITYQAVDSAFNSGDFYHPL